MRNTFRKYERLCNVSLIENLFRKGHTIHFFPLVVKWMISPVPLEQTPCQVLLIAPKRLFKRATERNRRKRLLKESFRLKKHTLYDFLKERNLQICLSIAYINGQDVTNEQLNNLIETIFDKLMRKISTQLEAER